MLKYTFTKVYLSLGVAALLLFAVAELRGALLSPFGRAGVDTSTVPGRWATYRKTPAYSGSYGGSSPGRSPGSSGGSSGGWSGGK